MERDQAVKIVGYLNASFPTNKLDDSAAQVFVNFIQPLDFESCRWAVKQWIQNEKWFPSVAEITEVTRREMTRRRSDQPALPSGGRYLSRTENQARLAKIQAQLASASGPLFNDRSRRAGLEQGRAPQADAPEVRPAPPSPRSRPHPDSTESS